MKGSTEEYVFATDSIATDGQTDLPADSAFVSGTLQLPHTDIATPPAEHGKALTIEILVAVSVIFFILNIRKVISILPYIFGCLVRWKESANVEYSMRVSRDRDDVALLFFVPFCMVASKYDLLPYLHATPAGEVKSLLITTGTVLAYLILRLASNALGRIGRCPSNVYGIATKASRTFFCTASVFMLATAGIMSLASAGHDVIRTVLLYEMAFVYIVFILRKSQIFKNSCSLFSTILYLCTLEILPTGILVAAAMYLQ